MVKSDFQQVLPEDTAIYNKCAKKYLSLNSEDGETAFDLMKESWSIAQRWSEIQASTSKIANMDNVDIMKTDFKTWAYQRYRQMQLIHESCRVIWRQANEQALFFERQGL